jgi:transcriptional regulator with XRE-family HTH domain
MEHYTKEQLGYVLNYVRQVYESRHLKQTVLAADSEVEQSTISRLFKGRMEPTAEILRKLCAGLGTNFEEVVRTPQRAAPYLLGYLATPLTGLSDRQDRELRRVVATLKNLAGPEFFTNPRIELYWPGDFTHPKANPEHTPEQVYTKDRAAASTCNFLVILALDPSYGVGQENEIAIQAGNPAIRFLQENTSRMLRGSFLHAQNIMVTGSLESGISFDHNELTGALRWVQQNYFLQFPLYQNMNGHGFGDRLGQLLEKRVTNRADFAAKLSVAQHYLNVMTHESFVVSNPSARLLRRLAVLLGVSIGYLLGDSKEADSVWVDSQASWRKWTRTPGIQAGLANDIREDWEAEYLLKMGQLEPSYASHRNEISPRQEKDWDIEYQSRLTRVSEERNGQDALF